MLRVIWDDYNDDTFNDFEVKSVVNEAIEHSKNRNKYDFITNQMVVILAFQLAVKQKKISYKDIIFVYNDEEIKIDQNGNHEKWPFPGCYY